MLLKNFTYKNTKTALVVRSFEYKIVFQIVLYSIFCVVFHNTWNFQTRFSHSTLCEQLSLSKSESFALLFYELRIITERKREREERVEVGFHKFRGNLKLHHWNERARKGTEIYPQCRTHSGFPLLIPKFGRPRFCSLFSYASDIRPHYSARSKIY